MSDHIDVRDDAALVLAVRVGDRQAFDALLPRYYPSVIRLCQRLLGQTAEAHDIAQEAALQAFLGLDRLQDPDRFGAWLHAITANLARKALRRRPIWSLDALDLDVQGIWAEQATPEELYARRETHEAIIAALQTLSGVNRAAVIGFFLEGYSYAELAALLEVPVSTVRGRVFQGRQQLKRALAPLGPEKRMPQHQQQEVGLKTPELVEMRLLKFVAPFERERLVLLRAVGTERDVPLRMSAIETDVLDDSRRIGAALPQPQFHDLTLRLMERMGAELRRVVVQRLVDTTFYVSSTFVHGGQEMEIDARLGEALILATQSGTPIYMARPLLRSTRGCGKTGNLLRQPRCCRR